MFVGKVLHTVNRDGRVSIPSKMRDIIKKKYNSDELYLMLMPEKFICLFPSEEFEKLASRLDNPQITSLSRIMDNERYLCADAELCTIDSSGRIFLPPEMKESAEIGSEVMFIGARSHIELWNPNLLKWKKNQQNSDRIILAVAQKDVYYL